MTAYSRNEQEAARIISTTYVVTVKIEKKEIRGDGRELNEQTHVGTTETALPQAIDRAIALLGVMRD